MQGTHSPDAWPVKILKSWFERGAAVLSAINSRSRVAQESQEESWLVQEERVGAETKINTPEADFSMVVWSQESDLGSSKTQHVFLITDSLR
eukprot:52973-Pelagomonas_calceolata.AAC.2